MLKIKNKKIFTMIFSLLFFVGIFFVFNTTFAQSVTNTFEGGVEAVDSNIALGSSDIRVIVTRIINVLLSLLGIITVGIVAYGGFLWMTAGGNDEQVSKAKKFIINGVIGLAIVLSSWAITSFVFSRLGWATGIGEPGDGDGGGSGGNASWDCDVYPSLCFDSFVVRSITPNTKTGEEIEMHDVVIRVVFSNPIDNSLGADEVFDILDGNNNINDRFDFNKKNNNYVVEAVPKDADYYPCDGTEAEGILCLTPGNYSVRVRDITDNRGNKLETSVDGFGDFPKESSFRLQDSNPILDEIAPELDFYVKGANENNILISKDGVAEFVIDEKDDKSNSYFVLKTYKVGDRDNYVIRHVNGPRVNVNSSDEFIVEFPFVVPSSFMYKIDYIAEVTAYDSDHNETTKTLKFNVVPGYCLDDDSTNDDENCGSGEGAICNNTNDCNSGLHLKCVDDSDIECVNGGDSCTCERWPYIESIEQDTGKAGNWVTVYGYNFGDEEGIIKFGENVADLAPCSNDIWTKNWVIAQVPEKIDTDPSEVEISLTTDDNKTETTDDFFGPADDLQFTYNDTARPGLCSVLTYEDGLASSTPKVLVHSDGESFGIEEPRIFFGSSRGESGISTWTDTDIYSSVPYLEAGKYGVFVRASSGEDSNTVPFNILESDEDYTPFIASIDPVSTTPGSYITINGKNFGYNEGVVELILENGDIISADDLPEECGDKTWTDTQIIVKVPQNLDNTEEQVISVKVISSSESLESNTENLGILIGDPNPSICNIIKSSGGAPLLGDDYIQIIGENFGTDPKVFFWNLKAGDNDLTTWLMTNSYTNNNGQILDIARSVEGVFTVKTNIPFSENYGYSMSTGPIKINSENSNGYTYKVNSCVVYEELVPDGFQCCKEGPEEGLVKKSDFMCEGESREAGYVWRMTTGKIPKEFKVIESCGDNGFYSPTPWSNWKRISQTTSTCINAQVQISFTLDVNSSTVISGTDNLNTSTINIYTCNFDLDENKICDNNVSTDFKILNITPETIILRKRDGSNLDSNTDYRIVLSKYIESQETIKEFGNDVDINEKLKITRPLDGYTDSAYYFDFSTSEKECDLTGAGIVKPSFTTYLLGIVQDDRFAKIFDLDRIFAKDDLQMHPLYYNVFGLGDEACVVLNAENEDWNWGPDDISDVDFYGVTSEKNDINVNDIAIATAWQNNSSGAEIYAQTENTKETFNGVATTTETTLIKATSTLYIDLGNPKVVERWPNCIEACINTEIGTRFNMLMATSTYDGNFELYRCQSESCNTANLVRISISEGNSDANNLRFYGSDNGGYLEPATWYLVKMIATSTPDIPISAISAINEDGSVEIGKNLTGNSSDGSYVWKFRTKESDAPCTLDNVGLDPDPFISTYIGQKTRYTTICRAAPDSCSPYGQYLNPWNFGWEWSVADVDVATTTQFSFSGKINPFCNTACLPSGSDISYNTLNESNYYYCGNGVVNPGEDCDIAMATENPGVSCGFDCLRPGNTGDTCGNGILEQNLGEECDCFNSSESTYKANCSDYCSDICLNTGSSRVETGDVNVSLCGSGGITSGEDCDIAIDEIGCSNNCLHTGTDLLQSWCDGYYQKESGLSSSPYKFDFTFHSLDVRELMMSVRNDAALACNSAVSVCGNGIVENGEECDCFNSSEPTYKANCSDYCSNKCLIKSDVPDTAPRQCDPELDEGCASDASFAGSSLIYSIPSVCGDGVVGIGENSKCELPSSYAGNSLGQNPVQVVTSLGEVPEVKEFMTTTVNVTTTVVASYDEFGNVVPTSTENPITGSGDYTLQCGFEEDNYGENDCPINTGNVYGVANNSCCFVRPERVGQYPFIKMPDACPNTLIKLSFNRKIDPNSVKVNDNLYIIEGLAKDKFSNCATGTTDISGDIENYIAINEKPGFFTRIWNKIKTFFAKIFGLEDIYAENLPAYFSVYQNNDFNATIDDYYWCKTEKIDSFTIENNSDDYNSTSTLNIKLNNLLTGEAEVFVMLQGGVTNIKDEMGVGIKNPFTSSTLDYWNFKTQKEVCKISEVTVDPESYIFRSPSESETFQAQALTDKGQAISPISGVYNWIWSWLPTQNSVFIIPGGDTNRNSITSKGVEGQVTGIVSADVIEDVSDTENHVGRSFAKLFNLTAYFCSNIWPSDGNVSISETGDIDVDTKFTSNKYNFDMLYCADDGNPFTKIDDLPRFDSIKVISDKDQLGEGYCSNDLSVACTDNTPCVGSDNYCIKDNLARYILFSEDTNDVIGIQVFRNYDIYEDKVYSLEEWYKEKFRTQDLGDMQLTEIAGYPTLTDGKNYYINAYNLSSDNKIFNNIYLFSLDVGASEDTLNVFEQLINSLQFNINMTNHNLCLAETGKLRSTDPSIANRLTQYDCITDFDCLDSLGNPKGDATNGYTSGICSNQKTKFFRDMERVEDLTKIQDSLDYYFDKTSYDDFRADLQSGSYINNYTNSRWSSWGYLGSLIGGDLPMDPVNEWVGCDTENYDPWTCWNPVSSTFSCPAWSQIYEYEFTSSSPKREYNFYAPMEFFTESDEDFLSKYINLDRIKVEDRYCLNATRSAFEGVCGDGIINKNSGEECEIGQSKIVNHDASFTPCGEGQYATSTCNNLCKWEYGSCISVASLSDCGNGITEDGEECDDGVNNGQYGSKCTTECTATSSPVLGFCGNGKIDYKDVNGDGIYSFGDILLEKCDKIGGICNFISDTGTESVLKPRVHILLDISGSMNWCVESDAEELNDTEYYPNEYRKDNCDIEENSRWYNVKRALQNIYDDISASIDFSLSVFGIPPSDQQIDYGYTCINTFSKSCLLHNTENENISILNKVWPDTNTPTGEAIEDIYNDIKNNTRYIFSNISVDNLPIVFLITDGNPSGDISDVVNNISDLYLDYGIKTYVLGFSGISTANMEDFAEAGGTKEPYYISDSGSIVNVFDEILGCGTYSPVSKYYTCSYDCQSFGEYCGDGMIQWSEGEECDDGNKINNDACFNDCQNNDDYRGVCRNGILDEGEECDLGNENGAEGSVCTYDCKIVEGNENVCGNGIIEEANNEQCDLGSSLNGEICPLGGNDHCYYCSTNCQVMVRDK